MNQQHVCLLSGAPNEPSLECFCFLEYGVIFFIIKPHLGFIKLKKNKNKGC